MNVCATCQWKIDGTIHVMHYGDLPDYRCGRNPATGKAFAGGKSVRVTNARVNAQGKRARAGTCRNAKPVTTPGRGQGG